VRAGTRASTESQRKPEESPQKSHESQRKEFWGANTTRTRASWQNRGDLARDKVDGNLLLALFAGDLRFTDVTTVL
jgi:hypothetical protein